MLESRPTHRLHSHSWRLFALCVGVFAPPLAAVAVAQDPLPIELEWSAPDDCPSRADALHILRERLTEPRPIVPLRAHAQIVRHGAGYRLDLDLIHQDTRAHRSLKGSQCGPLAEAAAVLIVLAIDSERAPAAPQSELPDAESPASSPSGAQVAPASDTSESSPASAPKDTSIEITHDAPGSARATRVLHLQLWAAVRADVGTFPHQPALGVQAQLVARLAPLYFAIGATYWLPRDQRSASYPNARLRGSGVFGDLSLGWDVSTKAVVLTPALHAELGLLNAEARGIASPEGSRALWFAFGPSMSATLSILSDFWLGLEISGLIPAYRTHWLVRTPDSNVPAFDAAPMVLRIAVRVGYTLR